MNQISDSEMRSEVQERDLGCVPEGFGQALVGWKVKKNGMEEQNSTVEKYLKQVSLFWTASSQLDLEIYGSETPEPRFETPIMENLIRAGFTHYICFESSKFKQDAWKN